MFKNFFKIAWRSLAKNKGYTTIKVLGLMVGISCCILILLFIKSEWSYDKFHSQSDRLYRVWQDEKYEDQRFVNSITPLIMAPTLEENIPEIEETCRVINLNPLITVDDNQFSENILIVDQSFFNIFDFQVSNNEKDNFFKNENSVVISETSAKKYFGNENPVGQDISILLGNDPALFTISSVIKDAPEESSIKYGMLIPYTNVLKIYGDRAEKSWFNVFAETYVLMNQNSSLDQAIEKFPSMMAKALGENYSEGAFELYLQPITEIHLDNEVPQGIQPISNPKYSYILLTIGILILLIACANFIILSIGHSSQRAKEVGVRKVMGAEKRHLIYQFMGEAIIITLLSMILGIVLAFVLLNPFNSIINRNLEFPLNLWFFSSVLILGASVAFIAGFYPSIILSKYNAAKVLKGKLSTRAGYNWLRKGLVTGQFVASIALISCAILIGQQIDFFKNKDLGYDNEHVVIVDTNLNRAEGMPLAELYKNKILASPRVRDVSVSLYTFNETPWVNLGFTDERKVYTNFQYNAVDDEFIKTMNINVLEGRGFDSEITSDKTNAAIVNEEFVKTFNIKEPIGKILPGPFKHEIVGVVKDFNFQSLHTPISPLLLTQQPDSIFRQTENIGISFAPQPRISIRLKPGNLAENMSFLKNSWQEIAPNQDFSSRFLDDSLEALYEAENRTSTIVKIASVLSIIIALMGLFAMITLTLARRKKEIGIRRVLGAQIGSIVNLMSIEYAKLILLASLIAVPLAWWFMRDWLSDFAYSINIQWWVFMASITVVLILALGTVAFKSVHAALSNPTKSLRIE